MEATTAESFAQAFARFVDASPTPFHCVREATKRLSAAGFVRLSERAKWSLAPGGKYFFTRNSSTLVAFAVGGAFAPGNGFKVVGAHTDSPVLKVKPVSKREKNGFVQVGVETYGGGLWYTWFDRDLGIAGRVVVKREDGTFQQRLIHVKEPVLRVPSLCVHLQSADERAALKVNAEEHLTPILSLVADDLNKASAPSSSSGAPAPAASATAPPPPPPPPQPQPQPTPKLDARHPPALLNLLARELRVDASSIVDLELTLCDTQPAQLGGANREFLFSPRLDNQMHCFTSVEALAAYVAGPDAVARDADISMICLFDHEEVGSESAGGAMSPVLRDAVQRISECFQTAPGSETYKIALDRSFLVSADGAHACHPNYAGKHEQNHQPKLNAGTVIKTNSNQRYATNGVTGFFVRELARRAKVPVQEYVVRQDSPCGTTIGPILAANTGIRTVDIGIPQLSMHSVRETCGVKDLESNFLLLREFFASARHVDDALASASEEEEDVAKV